MVHIAFFIIYLVSTDSTSIALQVTENFRLFLKNKKIEYKLINKEKEKLKEQTALMEEMFDEDINTVLPTLD